MRSVDVFVAKIPSLHFVQGKCIPVRSMVTSGLMSRFIVCDHISS
jgi:hypothetical protein